VIRTASRGILLTHVEGHEWHDGDHDSDEGQSRFQPLGLSTVDRVSDIKAKLAELQQRKGKAMSITSNVSDGLRKDQLAATIPREIQKRATKNA
jgi:hypothetical protein